MRSKKPGFVLWQVIQTDVSLAHVEKLINKSHHPHHSSNSVQKAEKTHAKT